MALKGDLAARDLAGRVFVPHFADPMPMQAVASAPVIAASDGGARAVTQMLAGEGFAVLDFTKGFAWGYCMHDNYVGYVAADRLARPAAAPTHAVTARAALIFTCPDIKTPVIARHEMGARLHCATPADAGDFLATGDGWVHRRHVEPVDAVSADAAALAERLIGAPYRWGGRGGDGLDCSGLVQMVLGLCGIAVPRDCDQQQDVAGRVLAANEPLGRGDLVYFPGHVGIMRDAATMIHANAFHMQVSAEPLADVLARHANGAAAIVARRTFRP